MKNRLLAMVLAALMLLVAFSAVALAENEEEVVDETTTTTEEEEVVEIEDPPVPGPSFTGTIAYPKFSGLKGYNNSTDKEDSVITFTKGKELKVIESGDIWTLVEFDVNFFEKTVSFQVYVRTVMLDTHKVLMGNGDFDYAT
ncbi:hypothetical protein LJC27_04925 [Christensenellaceae bacterium OttesenSCG-928-M15]|nr:hypothetical protein [Christensenellaceae bacterium OttesenSCG-928-M15]